MKQLKNFTIACGILALSACGEKPAAAPRSIEAKWLIGKWENNTPEGKALEAWEMRNDSTFAGKSYFIKNTDTLSSEKLSLEFVNGRLCYIPTVKEQNEGKPVTFTLKSQTETSLAFENPAHDFPQLITYTLVNSDSLVAEISGKINGEQQSQTFPMRRVK